MQLLSTSELIFNWIVHYQIELKKLFVWFLFFLLLQILILTNEKNQVKFVANDGVAIFLNGTELYRNNLQDGANYETFSDKKITNNIDKQTTLILSSFFLSLLF